MLRLVSQRSRLIRRLAIIAGLLLLIVWFRRPLFQGNFGTVDPTRVYRSAQPGDSLEDTIRRNQLGTVVNLRGGSAADEFYRHEVETVQRLGVEFYDLPISATRRPTRRELMLALSVLDRCQYPILIHCKWGSDRTGLLSALYRLVILGESPESALNAFTTSHGHFAAFGPQKLHEPFDEYAAWLRAGERQHNPATFRSWLEKDYQSDDVFVEWPQIFPGPRPSRKG